MKKFNKEVPGISTGFHELDYQWGGLIQGNTYLIGARPSMGKRAFILNMILHMTVEDNQKVALFSLELSKEHILSRILDMNFIKSRYRGSNGEVTEWPELNERLLSEEHMINSNLVIYDTETLDIEELDRELALEEMSGVKVVFIDYLQLLSCKLPSADIRFITYYICERIKKIAMQHNVAIVVLSQLNRNVDKRKNHRPVVGDFDYKDIPNYFDNVSFIYRDDYYNYQSEHKGIAEIITVRNNHGMTGVVEYAWLPEYQKFCSIERYCWDEEKEWKRRK